MAARTTISRAVLFILGLAGIAAGVIFLLGFRHLGARLSEVSLGIAGIAGGIAMVRIAMTSEATIPLRP